MSETIIHMVGHAGTDIDYRRVPSGVELSTFRLASTPRRWDRRSGTWLNGTTSWMSVQCWRSLAEHVRDSVRRGDPLIVVGKLRTEEWTKDGVRNSRFLLEAITVGHDLTRGVARFQKRPRVAEAPVDDSGQALEALQQLDEAETVEYVDEEGEPLSEAS